MPVGNAAASRSTVARPPARTTASTSTSTKGTPGSANSTPSSRLAPPTADQLRDLSGDTSAAQARARKAWLADLRALWSRADERFADVAWCDDGDAGAENAGSEVAPAAGGMNNTGAPLTGDMAALATPPTSPRLGVGHDEDGTEGKSAQVVCAHRALILARAPRTFASNAWLELPTVPIPTTTTTTTTTTKPPSPAASSSPATRSATPIVRSGSSPSVKSSSATTAASRRTSSSQPPSSFRGAPRSSGGGGQKHSQSQPLPAAAQSSLRKSPPIKGASSTSTSTRTLTHAYNVHGINVDLSTLRNLLTYLYTGDDGGCPEALTEALSPDAISVVGADYADTSRLTSDMLSLWKSRHLTDVTVHVRASAASASIPTSPSSPSHTPQSMASPPSTHAALTLPPMADVEEEESAGAFAVHRFVLVSRCPYFAAQFLAATGAVSTPTSTSFADSDASHVHLPAGPPFTPTALYFTLGFLYTGTLHFSARTFDLTIAFEIWRVAAYLQVRSLTALVASVIAHDFCHAFRCNTATTTSCATCPRRVPRTLTFAAAPDVGDAGLYHLALRALTRGEFAVYWDREVGGMDVGLRADIAAALKRRVDGGGGGDSGSGNDTASAADDDAASGAGAVVGILRQLMRVTSRLDSTRTVKWVDNLRALVDDVTAHIASYAITHFDALTRSASFGDLVDGVGMHYDVLERLLQLVVDGLPTHNAGATSPPPSPRIYQSLVSNLLLRGEEGLAPGPARDVVESARLHLLKHLSKRWVNVRASAGFNALEKWALSEIAGEIDVKAEDLLLPESEAVKPSVVTAAAGTPTVRKRATNSANSANGAAAAAERPAGPINLRAAVLNRNAARVGTTAPLTAARRGSAGSAAAASGSRPSSSTTATTTMPRSASGGSAGSVGGSAGGSAGTTRATTTSTSTTARKTPTPTPTPTARKTPTPNPTLNSAAPAHGPPRATTTMRALRPSQSNNQLRTAAATTASTAATTATTGATRSRTPTATVTATATRRQPRSRETSNESAVSARSGTGNCRTAAAPAAAASTRVESNAEPTPPPDARENNTNGSKDARDAEADPQEQTASSRQTSPKNLPSPPIDDSTLAAATPEAAATSTTSAAEPTSPAMTPSQASPPLPSPPLSAVTRPARPTLGSKVAGLAARFSGGGSTPVVPAPVPIARTSPTAIKRADAFTPTTTSSPPPAASSSSKYSSAAAFAARKRRLSTTPRSRTTSHATKPIVAATSSSSSPASSSTPSSSSSRNQSRATSPLVTSTQGASASTLQRTSTLPRSLSTHPVYAAAKRKSNSTSSSAATQHPTRSASVVSLAERRATARRRSAAASAAVPAKENGAEHARDATQGDVDVVPEVESSEAPTQGIAFPVGEEEEDQQKEVAAADDASELQDQGVAVEESTANAVVKVPEGREMNDQDQTRADPAEAAATEAVESPAVGAEEPSKAEQTESAASLDNDAADLTPSTADEPVDDKAEAEASVEGGSSDKDNVAADQSAAPQNDDNEVSAVTTADVTDEPTPATDTSEGASTAEEKSPSAAAEPSSTAGAIATDAETTTADDTSDDVSTSIAPSTTAENDVQPKAPALEGDAEESLATPAETDDSQQNVEAERSIASDAPAPTIDAGDTVMDDKPVDEHLTKQESVEASGADEVAGAQDQSAEDELPSPQVEQEAVPADDGDALPEGQESLNDDGASGAVASSDADHHEASSAPFPSSDADVAVEPLTTATTPLTPRALREKGLPEESERTPRPSKFFSDAGMVPALTATRPTPRAARRFDSTQSLASPPLAPPSPCVSAPTTLSVGIPCIIWPSFPGLPPRTRMRAVVKYIGPVDGFVGAMVGVEVPLPLPDPVQACRDQFNDGSVNGKRYFHLGPAWSSSVANSGAATPASVMSASPPSALQSSGSSRLSVHLDMFARAEREARKRRIARLQAKAMRIVSAPSSNRESDNEMGIVDGTATIRAAPRHSAPLRSSSIFSTSQPTSPTDENPFGGPHQRGASSGSFYGLGNGGNASVSTLTGDAESDLEGDGESSVFGMRISSRNANLQRANSRRLSMLRSPSMLSLASLHEQHQQQEQHDKLTTANLRSLSGRGSSSRSSSPSPSAFNQHFDLYDNHDDDDTTNDTISSGIRRQSNKADAPPPPPSAFHNNSSSLHPFALSSRSRRSSWSPSIAGSVRSISTATTTMRRRGSRLGGGAGSSASFVERMEDDSTPRVGLFVRPDEVVWVFEDE